MIIATSSVLNPKNYHIKFLKNCKSYHTELLRARLTVVHAPTIAENFHSERLTTTPICLIWFVLFRLWFQLNVYLLGLPLPIRNMSIRLNCFSIRIVIVSVIRVPYFVTYFAVLVIVKFAYHFCFVAFRLLDRLLIRYSRPY